MANDQEKYEDSFIKFASLEIPEELIPDLLNFLEENDVFVEHVRGLF